MTVYWHKGMRDQTKYNLHILIGFLTQVYGNDDHG